MDSITTGQATRMAVSYRYSLLSRFSMEISGVSLRSTIASGFQLTPFSVGSHNTFVTTCFSCPPQTVDVQHLPRAGRARLLAGWRAGIQAKHTGAHADQGAHKGSHEEADRQADAQANREKADAKTDAQTHAETDAQTHAQTNKKAHGALFPRLPPSATALSVLIDHPFQQ